MRRLKIAIQPDDVYLTSGRKQSFSKRWGELIINAGHEVVVTNAYKNDFFDILRKCDGFMWYFWNAPSNSDLGKRLILAISHGMHIPTFPNWQTCWTFEDKHAQRYLLDAANIPIPDSWVFWSRSAALEFAENAEYPLVVKLSFGIASKNVCLVANRKQARYLIEQLFQNGISLISNRFLRPPVLQKTDRLYNAARALLGKHAIDQYQDAPIQRGSILFQEFLEDNSFDTRVTVIGNRSFAFRRLNRPGDFRASGSGRIDWEPKKIDIRAIKLGFRLAQLLHTQVITLDILKKADNLVVSEISYYYEAWAVQQCPGHWRVADVDGDIEWINGEMHPADAILDDFIDLV